MMAAKSSQRGICWRLAKEMRPYWPQFTGLFLLSLLAPPLALLAPLPLKIVVDSVLDKQPLPVLLQPGMPAGLANSASGLLVFAVGLGIAVALFNQLRD